MKDKFSDLEEPKIRTLPTAIAVLAIFAAFFAYRVSHTKPIEVAGVVDAITAEGTATIRLESGLVVHAAVSASHAPTKGAHVTVLEDVSLFSAPAYRIADEAPSS